jgi:DNA-binding NarL/FixJ family response regulator
VNVLVVDDAPGVRARLVAMLACITGVRRVVEAASATEALQALRTHAPHVVVLDVRMPDSGGLALATRVKQECPDALLVVLTNESTDQHRRRCLGLGADSFFDKSREFDAVIGLITDLAARAGDKR